MKHFLANERDRAGRTKRVGKHRTLFIGLAERGHTRSAPSMVDEGPAVLMGAFG